MRFRKFKFTRGDIVQVSPGLEFASPLDKSEDRREEVEILDARAEKFYGKIMKSYLVRSLNKPERVYILQENFIQLARQEERSNDGQASK